MRRLRSKVPLLIVLFFAFTGSLRAATYYVATTGSGSVCSLAAPCLSIATGISKLSSGDTLTVAAGSYTESTITSLPSGSAGNQITIQCASHLACTWNLSGTGEHISIGSPATSYVTIQDFHFIGNKTSTPGVGQGGGIAFSAALANTHHHISILNNEIEKVGGADGMSITGSRAFTIRGNYLLNNGGYVSPEPAANETFRHGIYLSTNADSNTIDSNIIQTCTGYGLHNYPYGSGVNSNIYTANTVSDCKDGGVVLQGDNLQFINNLVYSSGATYGNGGVQGFGVSVLVYNNTIYGNTGPGLDMMSGAGTQCINNIVYSNSGTAIAGCPTSTTNLTSNPSFVNAGTDFHLQAGSSAIGTGTNLSATFTTDASGMTRTLPWSVGAYNYIDDSLTTIANTLSSWQWAELTTNHRVISTTQSTGPDSGNDLVMGDTLIRPNAFAAVGTLVFASKMQYDLTHGLLQFYGGLHGNASIYPGWFCNTGDMVHFDAVKCGQWETYAYAYTRSSNNWAVMSANTPNGSGFHHMGITTLAHGDGRLALDSATGNMYEQGNIFGGGDTATHLYKYTYSTNTWAAITPGPESVFGSGFADTIYTTEWFPDYSGLVVMGGNGGNNAVLFWNGSAWANILSFTPETSYPVALYNPTNHDMLVGGGQQSSTLTGDGLHKFWIIAQDSGTWKYKLPNGTFTTNAATAVRMIPDINLCSVIDSWTGTNAKSGFDSTNNRGLITVDPVTGHYIWVSRDGSCNAFMREYDPTADAWTVVTTTIPPSLVITCSDSSHAAAGSVAAVAIPSYDGNPAHGAIAFLNDTNDPNGWTVWIYKHSGSAGGGDTTPPSAPGNFRNTAITASTAEFMWSASTDNSSVAGYKIEKSTDGGVSYNQINTTGYLAYNDTGLTANTSYKYRVRAYDAALNNSTYSSVVTVTTDSQVYSFSGKCALAGVVKCFDFDLQSELTYNWQTPGPCDSVLGGLGYTNYPTLIINPAAFPYANVEAKQPDVNGQCNYMSIDTSVKHSGTGSIKYPIPNHSEASPAGEFIDAFKRFGDGTFGYIAPSSTILPDPMAQRLGSELWIQWYERFDTGVLAQKWDTYHQYIFATTSGAGATTITTPNCSTAPYNASNVGHTIAFMYGTNFTVSTTRLFTVLSVAGDTCSMVLDASPTPSSAGGSPVNGFGYVDGHTDVCGPAACQADGWKQMGLFGQPNIDMGFPNHTCCAGGFQAGTNLYQRGFSGAYTYSTAPNTVHTYEQNALRGCPTLSPSLWDNGTVYPQPPCVRYQPNQWMEFTVHLTLGTNNATNSHFEQWVDGQKTIDDPTFVYVWGISNPGDATGNGVGALNLLWYPTGKDPNQNVADTAAWYDDLIVSTNQIPMLSTAQAAPANFAMPLAGGGGLVGSGGLIGAGGLK